MDEEREDEAIIPEEDFREAIAACCEDPQLKRYFRLAPPGAKLFIGLGFYSTHFGDRVDPRQYAECQAEIEPSLTVNDLKYLIRFEDDKGTRRYLHRLLAKREETQESPVPEERQPIPVPADAIPVPRRRRRGKVSAAGLQWALRKDSVRWLPLACKAAAIVAVLLGGAVFVVANWERIGAGGKDDKGPVLPISSTNADCTIVADVEMLPISNANDQLGTLNISTQTLDKCSAPDAWCLMPQTVQTSQTSQTSQTILASEPVVAESAVAVESAPVRRKPSRSPRVVFTDGRRIVRHPGGKVEVPRVFSCAGAGVKPFWVYGPNPEVEAEKERKARREWRALVELTRAKGD